LPAIFTALKISATASVVGAIIAELPAGVQQGLGGMILNFNQYYITGPERLWASIVTAAVVGILFFITVSLLERIVLKNIVRPA
jgi:NitT/TauT family transport system permease protein